ncbi:MAG: alpha-glycosidase [Clostridium sp.]|nr:alpha-glycosidase [Clostridium sp.]
MNKYGIYHITEAPYAYAVDENSLNLKIRTVKEDIKKVIVYYKDKYVNNEGYREKEMTLTCESKLYSFYECEIQVYRNRYAYYFKLIDNDNAEVYLNERGLQKNLDNKEKYPFSFPFIPKEDVYEDVKWIQDSVVYQIFPDRFCNGDKSINLEGTLPWGEGELTHKNIYGGDLQGIIDKLDYLEDLGIDLVYVTPVFKSNTPHKYNTEDYFNIDPQFGTVELAKKLVKKCHEKGMKVVFDAVFNHSGDNFFAFKDILEKQEKSKYIDWYFIDKFPVSLKEGGYYTFAVNQRNMPKFNTNNREVREYLYKVGEYWIKEVGIDGWRLDVCDEVSHEFWRGFRKRIKSINKDAIIVGEIMNEGAPFLKGDQLDGIMNYTFKDAVTDFFGSKTIDSTEFSDLLANNRMIYMNSVVRQLWNLIDSHDTKRFLTECNDNMDFMKLAVGFQFTYLGIPYIYYGDEVGMNGGSDPQNRKCMVWDKEDQNLELFDYYKKLIKMRKKYKELVYGRYTEKYCKDNVIAFTRTFEDNKITVVINNNECDKEIPMQLKGIELLTDKKVDCKEKIKMKAASIIIVKEN